MTKTPGPAHPWSMRFAPHLGFPDTSQPYFLHTLGTADPVAQIAYIAELGFAGVEDNKFKLRPVDEQDRIGRALADHGLEMGCFLHSTETGRLTVLGSAGDDARARLRSELEQSLDAAARCGGRYLTTIAARDLRVPWRYQWLQMVENLKWMAEIAARSGVILCIETTGEARLPGMLLTRIADALAVVETVDSPGIGLLLDLYPIQAMEGDLLQSIRRCSRAIVNVQAGDCPGRLEPGSGEINFVNILRMLRETGYTGLVELEHHHSVPGAAGEQLSIKRLRHINAALANFDVDQSAYLSK